MGLPDASIIRSVRPECRAKRGVSRVVPSVEGTCAYSAGWFDMACGLLTTNGL